MSHETGKYIKDPNKSKKQVPGPKPDNFYTRNNYPIACTLTKTPNYVLITTAMQDEFGFFYGSSGSFAELGGAEGTAGTGKATRTNYELYPAAFGAVGTKLDIHPSAWSGSVRDAGQVQFVYKGGLDGSGRP